MSKKKREEEGSEPVEYGQTEPLNPESTPIAEAEQSDELAILKQKLEEVQAQAEEYKDGWQRSVADFSNFRKRIDSERSQIYQNAVADIIRRYLPVLDDLERALQEKPADPWASGVELICRKLKTILETEGIHRMEAEGQMFDPNYHEAVSQDPDEKFQSGQIIEVVQQGYMLGDRVIRPAAVRVAK